MRRVLILSDLHAGHRSGLTPPGWWYAADAEPPRAKWRRAQEVCWNWYTKQLAAHGPFDVIVCNGDAIDGTGDRSGGTELITTDRSEQVAMAAFCLRQAQRFVRGKSKTQIVITRGTPYHTGTEEDWEDVLGGEVGAIKVGNHEWVEVEGVVLDCKHKVGGSQIPHGRHTAVARERLNNILWSERGDSPRGDIIVRSHVHYHNYCGGADWLALTTPALQALGTKYGARQCSGTVDFGFVVFDCHDGEYQWRAVTETLRETTPRKVVV